MLPYGKYEYFNPSSDIASFWVSGLCSPWRSITGLAKELHTAELSHEKNKVKAVVNTGFGECYQDKAESYTPIMFDILRRNYELKYILPEIEIITCGCDVQKGEIYYAVRGWGKKDQSWLIDFGCLYGETDKLETWEQLAKYLLTPFRGQGKNGNSIHIACIDAGYRLSTVTEFCKRMGAGVFPCKGYGSRAVALSMSKADPYSGKQIVLVDDGYFKTMLFSKVRNETWFIPAVKNVDMDEYLIQMTSEVFMLPENGINGKWIEKIKDRNHLLDSEKLCLVGAVIAGVGKLDTTEEKPKERKFKGADVWQS
jgi:phage terminase large subunit GpA-like protein